MGLKVAAQQRRSRRVSPPSVKTSSTGKSSRVPGYRLQKAIGNSAMTRLLRTGHIQVKLTVSNPGDASEREADRVADQVMRMTDAMVSRRCDCNGCSTCKMRSEAAARMVQPMSGGFGGQGEMSAPTAVEGALGSPGRPLDAGTRAFFERRFGRDFGDVRVHTDGASAASAHEINAQAYTVGRDIVFRSSEYSPNTTSGRRLLAHELTHVVQQRHGWPVANRLMPYRDKGAANFGKCNSAALSEKELSSRKTDPWISDITITFDSTTLDASGELIPKGKLNAVYFSNPAKMADITADVVGGQASKGLTDKGDHKVTRIEGCGYHHTTVPKAHRITGHKRAGKYFKPSERASATMNFAVFFVEGKSTGNQAIHAGSLSSGSLACVHVGNDDTIRQINYHSVVGHTKVKVSYDAAPLANLCCERHKATGRMVSNPCSGQDAKKCP